MNRWFITYWAVTRNRVFAWTTGIAIGALIAALMLIIWLIVKFRRLFKKKTKEDGKAPVLLRLFCKKTGESKNRLPCFLKITF